MDPLGIGQAHCFRTHNELTMGLLGKYPLAPSATCWAEGYAPKPSKRSVKRAVSTLEILSPKGVSKRLVVIKGMLV